MNLSISKKHIFRFALICSIGVILSSSAVSKVNVNDDEGLEMIQGDIFTGGNYIRNSASDSWEGIKLFDGGVEMDAGELKELSEVNLGGSPSDGSYRGSINKVDTIYKGDGSWPGIEFTNNGIEFWGGYGDRHLEISGDNERIELHSDLHGNFKDIEDINLIDVNGCNGCDIAETVEMHEDSNLKKGEVVSINSKGRLVKSSTRYDKEVAGVISSDPVILMGDKNGGATFGNNNYSGNNSHIIETDEGKKEVPLALAGLVPVKVSDVNGAIEPGDKLSTSDIPGYAMKAEPIMEKNGREVYGSGIIGKAMEPLESGQGKIQMLASIE